MVRTLLVVGGSPKINWYEIFKGAKIHGEEEIKVEMAHWDEINLTSYSDSPPVVQLLKSENAIKGTSMEENRVCNPDMLLIRSACRGVIGQDWRNILYGFMHVGIPSINSLESLYICQEKPVIYGKLLALKKKLGSDNFPLIDQAYYSSWKTMTFASGFPLVAKVGTAHAGFGKMRIKDQGDFEDFRSVVALQSNYVIAEPFIEWDYDFRLQKIGNHYRAYKRTSSNWKGKGMNQQDEDIELTPQFKSWIDQAANALGMDMCALDGLHSKSTDKLYILELNDSAIGFNIRHQEEDLAHVRELVLEKINNLYPESTDIEKGKKKVETVEKPKKEEEKEKDGKKDKKKNKK